MGKEYELFVDRLEDLPVGEEVQLTIKDLTPGPAKYDNRIVKAIIRSSADKEPDDDTLWVRSAAGLLYPEPRAIKILGEVGEVIAGFPPYGGAP